MRLSFTVFISILSCVLKAQWLVLPSPPTPTMGSNNPCYGWYTLPHVIMPIADNKLLYTQCCQGVHSGITQIMISDDNLATTQLRTNSYISGAYCVGSFDAYNDNTFLFLLWDNQYGLRQFYTQNGFNSIIKLPDLGLTTAYATAFSPNYLYVLTRNNTNKVFKTSKITSTTNLTTFTGYEPIGGKLFFSDDKTGYTLAKDSSNRTHLLKSITYGANWVSIISDSLDPFVDYQVQPSGIIFVLKKNGAVYISINEGATFILLSSAPSSIYTCIRFANDTLGYIGGAGGVLYKTQNGGITWTAEKSNSTKDIQKIYTFNYTSYFVDTDKRVYYSGPPLPQANKDPEPEIYVYPNPVNDVIKIDLKSDFPHRLTIVNALGETIYEDDYVLHTESIEVSTFPAGVYIVHLSYGTRRITSRFLKLDK